MGTYGEAFSQAVSAELRAERSKKKIKIDDLIEATGLSKSAILNYLNGKRDIPTQAFGELTRALGVDPVVIFERVEIAMEQD